MPPHKSPDISAFLSRWYTSHAAVRRLWVCEEAGMLRVFVTLEPTLDGDDIHPTWLANGGAWANELQSCMDCTVQLMLVDGPDAATDRPHVGTVVHDLYWRDPYCL